MRLAPLPLVPLVLAVLAVRPTAAPGAALGGGREEPEPPRALVQLERWMGSFRRNGPESSPEDVKRLGALTSELRMIALAQPEQRPGIVLALLDLAGVRTAEEARAERHSPGRAPATPQTQRIRTFGSRELETLLDGDAEHELAIWIAQQVLAGSDAPEERRLAALELLGDRHLEGTKLALFGCAVESSPAVRAAAMDALVGWDDEGVHGFMLQQLRRLGSEPQWLSRVPIRRHFAATTLDPKSDSGRELLAWIDERILSADWREAFRGLQLVGALRDDPAVPTLIDALSAWIERRERGEGSRRIESEILRELERRSGRRMGPHPERWAQWWSVAARPHGDAEEQGEQEAETTWAGFFGLRPVTDRVVFVIDRSGSMDQHFGSREETRYSVAIDQMLGFLRELGPTTRFRVVVFSDEPDAWKRRLMPATEANLRSAERWLRYRSPKGGTYLRPAIREVMRLDANGEPDLRELEADTVIVLCDGETTDREPEWVPELLAGPNESAALAFHAVVIGTTPDGTLEALASGSGGDFVRVVP